MKAALRKLAYKFKRIAFRVQPPKQVKKRKRRKREVKDRMRVRGYFRE